MVTDIDASGVILTRCVEDGSPYYVLSYDDETGKSDTVTAGRGNHKTVLVYRRYKKEYCDSQRVRAMLALAESLEEFFGDIPLDIEFALDRKGIMHLLQVRRISTVTAWHPDTEHRVCRYIPHVETFVKNLSARRQGLFGEDTILGNMPDWNPTELIGVMPAPLSASLFRFLITESTWHEARASMGYRSLPGTELMVLVAGRVFIDVRASFNSLLPKDFPAESGEKIVSAWMERLAENPGLHDKVEFDIAQTVLDFDFEEVFASRYGHKLGDVEKKVLGAGLEKLTRKLLDISKHGSLGRALAAIRNLEGMQTEETLFFQSNKPVAITAHILGLLEICRSLGTIPFAIIARHAFVAEALLRSAIRCGILSQKRVTAFKASIHTVMGELATDTIALCRGEISETAYMERFGHLRPGTFDILSPCYRNRPALFAQCSSQVMASDPAEPFFLKVSEAEALEKAFKGCGLYSVNGSSFMEYARTAIQGREYAKFVFTRNLSAALEAIAHWGSLYGLGREDLSFLRIQDILDTAHMAGRGEMTTRLMQMVDVARMESSLSETFRLSYLIRGVRDVHVVPVHRSQPNFITVKKIEKAPVFLKATSHSFVPLEDRIVCIESADPGFDWIFTRNIAGLITQYGGANSHMAIRCAELQLPAAIGCGEAIFAGLGKAKWVLLDCGGKTIRVTAL